MRMKRNFKICKCCREMCKFPSRNLYICKKTYSKIGFHNIFVSENPMNIKQWSLSKVPKECNYYAEHFLMECNK